MLKRRIHKDKISSHSIRLPSLAPSLGLPGLMSFSTTSAAAETDDLAWTRACRAVLQVLKRVLVVESEVDRGAAV